MGSDELLPLIPRTGRRSLEQVRRTSIELINLLKMLVVGPDKNSGTGNRDGLAKVVIRHGICAADFPVHLPIAVVIPEDVGRIVTAEVNIYPQHRIVTVDGDTVAPRLSREVTAHRQFSLGDPVTTTHMFEDVCDFRVCRISILAHRNHQPFVRIGDALSESVAMVWDLRCEN